MKQFTYSKSLKCRIFGKIICFDIFNFNLLQLIEDDLYSESILLILTKVCKNATDSCVIKQSNSYSGRSLNCLQRLDQSFSTIMLARTI